MVLIHTSKICSHTSLCLQCPFACYHNAPSAKSSFVLGTQSEQENILIFPFYPALEGRLDIFPRVFIVMPEHPTMSLSATL